MAATPSAVAEYLAALPPERRAALEAVREVVRKNADPRLEEGMQYDMIAWYVPHSVFPAGYHTDPKQPLPYAALAAQKNYRSLYLMTAYAEGCEAESWIRAAWPKTAKKLDMGKCCIRFKAVEDLALDVVGEAIRRVSVDDHLASYALVDPRGRKRASSSGASTTASPSKRKPSR
jgi:hypothetical protein